MMKHFILMLTILLSGCFYEEPLRDFLETESDCSAYSKVGNTHYWDGEIRLLSGQCFEWNDYDTLVITSYGGSAIAAFSISTDILAYNITTIAHKYCYSSCVRIASYGFFRFYTDRTRYAVHFDSKGNNGLIFYDPRVDKEWLGSVLSEKVYFFSGLKAKDEGLADGEIKLHS